MKTRTLVAMLVVTCCLLTACDRKEPVVAEAESSSTAVATENIDVTEVSKVTSRLLTYEDIKDLPTYSGPLEFSYTKLYEEYSGNVSLLRKEGESSSTHYYVKGGECYIYLPDDTACLIQEEYDGDLTILHKGPRNVIEHDTWEISRNVFLPEDLEKLPEEPDWRDPSYVELVEQHKGNLDLVQNPDIQKPSSFVSLYDTSNELIIGSMDSTDSAIFRNGSSLVCLDFNRNNTLSRLSIDVLNPKKGNPGALFPRENEYDKDFFYLADDSPIFCLAEDGLYYYIIEAGEKKVVKVADITKGDYNYSGILESENCVFPVFKNTNSPNKLVTYPLKNAIVTEEEPWFYTVDKIELAN